LTRTIHLLLVQYGFMLVVYLLLWSMMMSNALGCMFNHVAMLSVFCHPTSEFIRVSHCSRNYTGSGQSPTLSLKDCSSACSLVECSEVLTMGYARRVREVGEWRGVVRMKS
jgi:hypothetical protein